jgi:peptidoglycan-associated lipoprotein
MLAMAFALTATSGFAQDGKLKIKVLPKHAYVFVDGKAIREGSETIPLPAGSHTVLVANYGYKFSSQDVSITVGKTTPLAVTLDTLGGPVSAPFGQIAFKAGDSHAAVLLDGTTPSYFAGNVGATNHDWWWHRVLLVPPGSYHVDVTRNGTDAWTGDVAVTANQKTSIDLGKNGAQTSKAKPSLGKLTSLPRYKGGWISDTIAVAGVTGSFSVAPESINCGQSSTLTWQSTEAADITISGIGAVAPSGTQTVTPHATTTYDFNAAGPGGIAKGTGTVNVNTTVTASLTANPTELHYLKLGDKVVTDDTSMLTWTTSNADSVSIDPIGKVDPNGSQSIMAMPKKMDMGPVDETTTYTLSATNVCGGSATQTAAIHITGSIEPIPVVVLQSIFYPTDYPDKKHPDDGLLKSQQDELAQTAAGFKAYLVYDPSATLAVEAHADPRGSKKFNQDLSQRRVDRIQAYLVAQGISADKIQTSAVGKDDELNEKAVKEIESTNPNPTAKGHHRSAQVDFLAYNRRADIVLMPSGQKSTQYYPNSADDAGILWQVSKPSLKKVEADQ